jgi:hypothetical protein
MAVVDVRPGRVDQRAVDLLGDASPEVADAWCAVQGAVSAGLPEMGLASGDRPQADVEVLAGALASCEYLVASRMHAAASAGCLPFGERGGQLAARGWSVAWARRLARSAGLAQRFDAVAQVWSAGIITSEHVDPIARVADRFTPEELAAIIDQLEPLWGAWSPAAISRLVISADRMLHPSDDPSRDEADAQESRSLSFSLLSDTVILAGALPRLEGELVIAAIDALADKLRSTADHVPAGARRADALVQLVNDAHARDLLPTRGGLPVALNVTVESTAAGDPIWTTSRGHLLTDAEARWAACDAAVTPVMVGSAPEPDPPLPDPAALPGIAGASPSPAARIAALAAALAHQRLPLAVGRTQRTATPAQRRALAVRDGGCIIPGCTIPAEACQVHHLVDWALGGHTDLPHLVLLCWAHHRQVDLRLWTITPGRPGGDPPHPPHPGAPPGIPWPANNNAPFTITRTPRTQWRQ